MDRIETFKMIMQKSDSNKVVILTNHYKIVGEVYECEVCNQGLDINLTNASMCCINDIYQGTCENNHCYDWLHVNLDKVVAYSFI